jgi:hypothetical protein
MSDQKWSCQRQEVTAIQHHKGPAWERKGRNLPRASMRKKTNPKKPTSHPRNKNQKKEDEHTVLGENILKFSHKGIKLGHEGIYFI